MKGRRRRPMFMVDLAVPRDIEQEVGDLDDVFLYTVDDLAAIVSENVDSRRAAVEQAEAIIETQVSDFMHWLDNRELVPITDEIELCRQYLALEKLRLTDRLNVEWYLNSMPGDALVPALAWRRPLRSASAPWLTARCSRIVSRRPCL